MDIHGQVPQGANWECRFLGCSEANEGSMSIEAVLKF